jgi:hypothetical protein
MVRAELLNRLATVRSFGHHRHVPLIGNEGNNALAQERMIVNNQNPNLGFIVSHSSLLRSARPFAENNRDHHDRRVSMP